jgi:hypothetical protein
MPVVTVRRTLEYEIEVPSDLDVAPEEAALREATVCSTAEADRETFEVILYKDREIED